MLHYSMRHRTQLYLDEDQYRWLKQRAAKGGSIAGVVRRLIDAERSRSANPDGDSFVRYLLSESPADSGGRSSVETIDRDLYG